MSNNNWAILGIAATDDREAIKKAYMEQLSKYNPEDDPEGFGRLRAAYEEVLKELDTKAQEDEADSTPLGQFMKRVEGVYNDFNLRRDVAVWKELLTDEVCVRLDMVEATEEKILSFLMNHYYLPQKVWVLLDDHFDWHSRIEALKWNFPTGFIDFVVNNTKQENLRYDLFTLDPEYTGVVEAHQFDRWIWLYYEIEVIINSRNINSESFLEMKDEIEALPIRHIYYDLQLARMYMVSGEAQQVLAITAPIFEQMPDDVMVQHIHGLALLANKQATEALAYFKAMLAKNPDDLNAEKGVIDAMVLLEDYEPARDKLMDILEKYPYDTYAMSVFWQVTGELVKIFEEKHAKDPEDLEVVLTLAKHYLNNRQYEQSQTLLEKISPIPEDPRYYAYLAECYAMVGNYEKSIELYKTLVTIERKYRYYAKFAAALSAIGEYEQALVRIEEGLALEDDDKLSEAQLYDSKGLTLFHLERFEEALNALDEGIAINDQGAHLYIHKASVYRVMGLFSEAIDCCDRAIEIYPFHTDAYSIQMEIFNEAGMYEQMLAISDRADQVGFDSPRVKYHKAGALRMMGNHDQAYDIIKILLDAEFDEGYRDFFYVEAAHLATAEKDWETALDHIQKAIDLYPDFLFRYVVLGNIHRLRGDYNEALKVFDNLLTKDPKFVFALLGRGDVYFDQEKYDRAREDFEGVLAISEDNEEAFEKIAETYHAEERYDEAVQWTKRRLELFETMDNYLRLAWLYERMKQLDKAEDIYHKITERFPDSDYANRFYGIYLRSVARYEEAIEQFNLSLEKYAEQADVYEEIAFCLEGLKRYEEALVVLDKGEALQSNSMGAIVMRRAVIFEKMGNYSEALDNMFKATELEGQFDNQWKMSDVYTRIGLIYEMDLNDAENALKYYQIALENNEKSVEALRYIGDLYLYFFKDYRKAIEYYDRKIELEPDEPHGYVVRAKAYSLLKDGLMDKMMNSYRADRDYKKALELYEQEAKDKPDIMCSQVYMASCYVGLKKYDMARKIFQRMLDEPGKKLPWCEKEQCDSCFYWLGQICEAEKNFSEALAYYEKAIAITNSVRHNKAKEEVMALMK